MAKPLDNSPQGAAQPGVLAATGDDVRGGKYHGPGGFMRSKGDPAVATPSPQAQDLESASRLWTLARDLTGATWSL
ncbi:hypothetical protein [Mycobacterium marseillense]|uniref:hypothetical protein n=1 Tax=Mycobacterium marseillense TaxID=701042 RepID=UPI00119F59DE|nr:hypothetical protein [Mycobacterium marseillense]